MPRSIARDAFASSLAVLSRHAFRRSALAQAYPVKPVRIVVPFAPGGRVDGIARVLGASMGAELGQPFVVDNRAGAGGAIGSDHVAKSAAGRLHAAARTRRARTRSCPTSIASCRTNRSRTSRRSRTSSRASRSSARTLRSASPTSRAWSSSRRRSRARYGFATSGVGTYGHFAGELLKIASGTDLVHVAYKGSGPALNDLAAGHVPLMIAGELVELAKAGTHPRARDDQRAPLARASRREDDEGAGLSAVHRALLDRARRAGRAAAGHRRAISTPPPARR